MEPDTTVRIDAALAAVPATMTVYRTEGPRTFARGAAASDVTLRVTVRGHARVAGAIAAD